MLAQGEDRRGNRAVGDGSVSQEIITQIITQTHKRINVRPDCIIRETGQATRRRYGGPLAGAFQVVNDFSHRVPLLQQWDVL